MYNIGIDIGGTKCAVVLGKQGCIDPAVMVTDKKSFPTASRDGWRGVVGGLLETADALVSENGITYSELHAVGISCGGPLDSKKGVINCPPNLPDWDGVPVSDIFSRHFGVPAYLQNDANACAVAEWKFGAGRGYNNLIFLTFGTGMGAGLILDGRLYSGACDLAGEVGHMRVAPDGPEGYGKRGSFEGFCSGGGLARMAREMMPEALKKGLVSPLFDEPEAVSAKTLAAAARNGDKFASEVYDVCAQKLGLGLSVLIDLLNPEAIIIGSIYQRNRELFDPVIRKIIGREALPEAAACCRILPAQLGDSIGDLAALSLAELHNG